MKERAPGVFTIALYVIYTKGDWVGGEIKRDIHTFVNVFTLGRKEKEREIPEID